MIAITTKYVGPTNTKGSRIVATGAKGQTVTIGYHSTDANSDEGRHHEAAKALCRKMGWSGTLIPGSTDKGYVFVFLPTVIAQLACNELKFYVDAQADGCTLTANQEAIKGELSYYFTVAPQA
jgi:hypothetical protein